MVLVGMWRVTVVWRVQERRDEQVAMVGQWRVSEVGNVEDRR